MLLVRLDYRIVEEKEMFESDYRWYWYESIYCILPSFKR